MRLLDLLLLPLLLLLSEFLPPHLLGLLPGLLLSVLLLVRLLALLPGVLLLEQLPVRLLYLLPRLLLSELPPAPLLVLLSELPPQRPLDLLLSHFLPVSRCLPAILLLL